MENADFDILVARYSRQVLNTALRILRDENAASDVHQDVFLQIWKRKKSYDEDINWGAYLYRVTIREAMKHIKKMKRFPQTSCQFEHVHSGDTSQPENRMVAAETQQRLASCISRLSDKQAEAFTLTRIEGLDYSQTAAIMGCKEETVRVHLHRALKQLASLMNPYLKKGGQS